MSGGETQSPLFTGFGIENKKNPVENKLINSFKPEDERYFKVGTAESLQKLDSDDVHFLRDIEEIRVVPVLGPEIESLNCVPDSIVSCRICVDQAPEIRNKEGILRGVFRVGYGNGEFDMVCEKHKPEMVEKKVEEVKEKKKRVKKVKERKMTKYTEWINDH